MLPSKTVLFLSVRHLLSSFLFLSFPSFPASFFISEIISFPVPFFQIFQIVVTSCHSMRRGAKAQEALNSLVLERKLKFLRNAASSADQERQDIARARCSQLPDGSHSKYIELHRYIEIHRNTTSVCRHPNKPNKESFSILNMPTTQLNAMLMLCFCI